eukprot:7391564-Prymnesium_polylepis.1
MVSVLIEANILSRSATRSTPQSAPQGTRSLRTPAAVHGSRHRRERWPDSWCKHRHGRGRLTARDEGACARFGAWMRVTNTAGEPPTWRPGSAPRHPSS